jgi:MFS family permease
MSWSKWQRTLQNSLIVTFYLPSLFLAFSMGLLAPVLPLYAKSFDVSYGLVGVVSAGAALGMLLGDVPAGVLVRRMGQRRAMLLGAGCAALSTAALFWTHSVAAAVGWRVLNGFGQALFSVARHAFIAGAVKTQVRGRTISLLGGIFRIGRFVGPTVGGFVAQSYGLRLPFLIAGAASGAAALVTLFFVRDSESAAQTTSPAGGSESHLLAVLRSRLRLLASAGAGQLFAQMIRAGRGIIIPLYAADILGLPVSAIGFVVGFSSAVDMLLFYPAGLIMDRLGRKYAIVPSFLLQATGMAAVPFTQGMLGLIAAATLIGFGNGLGSGSMMTLGADLAPQESRGEFLGVWRLIGDVGSSSGPLIVGGIADLVALPTATLMMSGAGLIAALIFYFLVPETLQKHRPAPQPSTSGGQASGA